MAIKILRVSLLLMACAMMMWGGGNQNNVVVVTAFTVVPTTTTLHSKSSGSSLMSLLRSGDSCRAPSSSTCLSMSSNKGFGAKEPAKSKVKSEGQTKRESEANRYEEIAASGGQEYNIYVRQFGSDDKSWFPCGAVSVPRGAQVGDAIYANVDALKTAIVRLYPRLKGFEQEFEFGSNLKVYPDDPIEVAVKRGPRPQGMSIGNWINTLLSPVDASKVKPPTSQ